MRGRYALEEAYRLAGLDRESTLLAPAYHCLTMLDPAINLGAHVLLYPLRPDLSPDLEKLDRVVSNYARPLKALLATHYFGLAQNFDDIKSWCDKRGIILVEDCSHVLFTEGFQATGTGIFGKYVIASPYKFFACEDGGLLYSPKEQFLEGTRTRPASFFQELRAIKRTIGNHWLGATTPADIDRIGGRLAEIVNKPSAPAELQIDQYSHPSPLFSALASGTAALRSSEWLVRHSPVGVIVQQRRRNYQRWVEGLRGLPNCHALYPDLPADCVPYMFPLYIDHPDPRFYWLRHLGTPIWRWDEMAVSSCLVANNYRLHLLHLPCHQSLSDEEITWMIAAVQEVMRHPARRRQ